MTPEPFRVSIPEADLTDLRRRLRSTRWADDIGNAEWTYGVERGWLEDMVGYWADSFDWRAQEQAINRFAQFRVEIDGVPIHFVHERAARGNGIPLVLTHGWPWTFWDYRAVIGPLTTAGFDVVVPSLPGFGFSTPLRTTGLGLRRIAELWVRLMVDVLGYQRFGAAGGDLGGALSAELGHAHPERLLGVYLMIAVWPGLDYSTITAGSWAPHEAWMERRLREGLQLSLSHVTVQRLDAQTLAYAMVDSPAGTAAWLWARRRAWSDHTGDVTTLFDRDFLCATASIYWLTRTIGSSFRLYADNTAWAPLDDAQPVVRTRTGIALFPKDLRFVPRQLAERATQLERWSVLPRGGHFGPAEQPSVVVAELTAFFGGSAQADRGNTNS